MGEHTRASCGGDYPDDFDLADWQIPNCRRVYVTLDDARRATYGDGYCDMVRVANEAWEVFDDGKETLHGPRA